MLQIDGSKRLVHINFGNNVRMQDVFHSTEGQVEYRHNNGEISTVRISTAGVGTRRVRIASLPLPPGSVGWSTTDAYVWVLKSNGLSSGNTVSSIQLPVGQRHSTRNYGLPPNTFRRTLQWLACYVCNDTSHIY